eukprot:jgi/Psemu1/286061/fgenesh1_pg.118_\
MPVKFNNTKTFVPDYPESNNCSNGKMNVQYKPPSTFVPIMPNKNNKNGNDIGDDATPVVSNLQRKVAKSVAIHKASRLALNAKKTEATKTPSAFAKTAKSIMEMEVMALMARLSLLEDLATMNDSEKMECLFSVLDADQDGTLSIVELANGLRKIKDPSATTTAGSLEEALVVAMDKVAHFDKDGDTRLDLNEFANCANQLAEALGATFHDVAEMFILSVVFAEDGDEDALDEPKSPYPEGTEKLCEDTLAKAQKEEAALRKVMDDDRMLALFHLFDLDGDGSVDFAEVVIGLYKMTEDLVSSGTGANTAMGFFDDDKNELLDYSQFTRFILQLITSTGRSFEEAIYIMTKSAASDEGGAEHLTKDTVLEKLRAAIAENEIVGPGEDEEEGEEEGATNE